jgi:hypothetical protein
MKFFKNNLFPIAFLFTVIFNVFLFLLTYIQYNSIYGTDFNKYGPYLNYYIFGIDTPLEEQGVGYFWLISEVSKFKLNSLLISPSYDVFILNFGIQFGNFLLFIGGCIGVYFLLRFFDKPPLFSLSVINLLALFPPIVGARLILKPEIFAFFLMPWLFLFLFKYFEQGDVKYLYFLIPIISLLITSKASITLTTVLVLLMFVNKSIFKKELFFVTILTFPIFLYLIYESYLVNGKYLWDHITPNGYDNVASFNFLYNLNTELFSNPIRNSQSNSLLGIILLDTFGDYWQRYWNNEKGWLNSYFPGDVVLNRIGIITSFFFYFLVLKYLLKEKNKNLKKIGGSFLLGIFVLLITIFNVFPFLTKNFNPGKGDPIKTHYFSFLLALALIYLVIKLHDSKKSFVSLFFVSILFIFPLILFTTSDLSDVSKNENSIKKILILNSCSVDSLYSNYINLDGGWCENESIAQNVCKGAYNSEIKPYIENDYVIYPRDESFETRNLVNQNQVVTVGNYFECLEYSKGGFIPQSSEYFFFNQNRPVPKGFFIILLLAIFTLLYEIIFGLNNKIK